jgi:cold shock CspA family protein
MPRSQTTSSKKEMEKKRLQKRKEKEERKRERHANAGEKKSLEDMMAYVDENGNISSTPPDPSKKKVISTDDIAIATPKGTNAAVDSVHTGKVTFFNSSKGYGFIKDDRTQESIFVHVNSVKFPIKENDKVAFHVERGPKGMNAISVTKI